MQIRCGLGREGPGGLARLTTERLGGILIPTGSSLQEEGNGLSRPSVGGRLEEQVNRLQWETCKMRAVVSHCGQALEQLTPRLGRCEGLALPSQRAQARSPGTPLLTQLGGLGQAGEGEAQAHYRVCNPIFGHQMSSPQRSPLQGHIRNKQARQAARSVSGP